MLSAFGKPPYWKILLKHEAFDDTLSETTALMIPTNFWSTELDKFIACSNLTAIKLDAQPLCKDFPGSYLWPSVHYLDISAAGSQVLPIFSKLPFLQTLVASDNSLEGFSNFVTHLKQLSFLDLSFSTLSEPLDLRDCKNLQQIILQGPWSLAPWLMLPSHTQVLYSDTKPLPSK